MKVFVILILWPIFLCAQDFNSEFDALSIIKKDLFEYSQDILSIQSDMERYSADYNRTEIILMYYRSLGTECAYWSYILYLINGHEMKERGLKELIALCINTHEIFNATNGILSVRSEFSGYSSIERTYNKAEKTLEAAIITFESISGLLKSMESKKTDDNK